MFDVYSDVANFRENRQRFCMTAKVVIKTTAAVLLEYISFRSYKRCMLDFEYIRSTTIFKI